MYSSHSKFVFFIFTVICSVPIIFVQTFSVLFLKKRKKTVCVVENGNEILKKLQLKQFTILLLSSF